MQKKLFIAVTFCAILIATVSFAAPVRQIGPVTIEGTIQEISWHPPEFIKGRPGFSGSLGHDRTMPERYWITLSDIQVTANGPVYYPYKNGGTARIVLDHQKENPALTVGTRVRITDVIQRGDEGGDWGSCTNIEIIQ